MTPRSRRSTPPARQRSGGSLVVSLLVHVVVIAAFVRAILVPRVFDSLFRWDTPPPVAERLTYVEQPRPSGGGGGGGLPVSEPPAPEPSRGRVEPAPAVRAPLVTPSGVPVPATPASPAPGGGGVGEGTGSGSGGAGDGQGGGGGLRPNFNDPRVWLRPVPGPGAPRSAVQRIDSMIASDFGPLRDSAAAEAARRQPGDWTFERDGKKYGIDSRFIHLGKFSLPTAVLGLLPLNQQANPTHLDEGRRLSGVQKEIQEQALRRSNDTDFKDVVRSIRERKDRERAERRAAAAAAGSQGSPP